MLNYIFLLVASFRILARSELLFKFSFSTRMTRTSLSGGVVEDQSLCVLIGGTEDDTGTRECAPPSPPSEFESPSAIQQVSSLFASILVEFGPLVKKAKDDASAMEACLGQIQTMLVQEKIVTESELHQLSASFLVFLGAHKVSLAEMGRRESSINALFSARKDILSYIYSTVDLLEQLSSDIRELLALAATASDPSARWEEDFFAVISSSSHRMRSNRVMQRIAVDANELPSLPPSIA